MQEGGFVKKRRSDIKMAVVSSGTKQAGEAQDHWSWVEATVWTERMLEALNRGVKGGKWFSLIDKIYYRQNLEAAFRKVKANRGSAGVDHVTIKMFEAQLDKNLDKLADDIRTGRYRPQQIKRVEIPKPGSKETRPWARSKNGATRSTSETEGCCVLVSRPT